jgi:hypothetical protein
MSKHSLRDAARCALADLEGVMPLVEPSGERLHPAWKTIEELRRALCVFDLGDSVIVTPTERDLFFDREFHGVVRGFEDGRPVVMAEDGARYIVEHSQRRYA